MADSSVSTPKLATTDGALVTALQGEQKHGLEQGILPHFLPRQRWFGAKDSTIKAVSLQPLGELVPGEHALAVADVELDEETQRYLLPLSARWDSHGSDATGLAEIRHGDRVGMLIDGALDKGFAEALMAALREGRALSTPTGAVAFRGSASLTGLGDLGEARALSAEQSNVSLAYGSKVILKLYRRLRAGAQPDVEVAKFLSDVAHFANTPEFLGEIQFRPQAEEPTTLAAAFAFVPNQGDAWSAVTAALAQDLIEAGEGGARAFRPQAAIGAILGRRTAEMHKALATPTDDPEFRVEPLTDADVDQWVAEAVGEAEALLGRLKDGLSRLPGSARAIAEDVLARRDVLVGKIRAAGGMTPSGGRSRIHGDYHLGQVLVAGSDVMIIDFEGEPKRSLAERRAKSSPLRDVAGMLRSFDYAAWTGLSRARQNGGGEGAQAQAERWREEATRDFLQAYETHIQGASSYPGEKGFASALTDLFLLQKAIYEVGYELANRPDWVEIPLSGVQNLLDQR